MLDWVNSRVINDTFYFDFKNRKNIVLKPIEAALYTIEQIKKTHPPPYTLYLSGGVDSQAMLYAWHISGEKFNTFSAVYDNKFNDHDLLALKTFADLHKIKINYYHFDVIDFLENHHDNYANAFICGSPQITTFIRLAELTTEGTVIMSGNFITGSTGIPDNNNWSLWHYAKRMKKNIVPYFFLETEDLTYSFRDNDYVNKMLENKKVPDIGYYNKVLLYQSYGFPILPQPEKYNGFEKIKDWYDDNCPRKISSIEKMHKLPGQTSTRNFDVLFRNKYEAKFSKYKYVILC